MSSASRTSSRTEIAPRWKTSGRGGRGRQKEANPHVGGWRAAGEKGRMTEDGGLRTEGWPTEHTEGFLTGGNGEGAGGGRRIGREEAQRAQESDR